MRVLLSFLPFFLFGFAVHALSVPVACLIAAGLGLAIMLGDRLLRGRSIKILEAGSVMIFAGLARVAAVRQPAVPVSWIWVVVDAGLLLIALVSLGIGRPFTVQYAREQVGPELWNSALFMAVNVRITCAWASAFAVMLLAQLVGIYLPAVPGWAGTTASILAAVGALRFTNWYPAHARQMRTAAPTW